MNFYKMDAREIERFLNSGQPYNSDDIIQSLLEQLTEVNANYEQLTDVLDYHGLSNYNAQFLDTELKELFVELDNLKYEIKELKSEV